VRLESLQTAFGEGGQTDVPHAESSRAALREPSTAPAHASAPQAAMGSTASEGPYFTLRSPEVRQAQDRVSASISQREELSDGTLVSRTRRHGRIAPTAVYLGKDIANAKKLAALGVSPQAIDQLTQGWIEGTTQATLKITAPLPPGRTRRFGMMEIGKAQRAAQFGHSAEAIAQDTKLPVELLHELHRQGYLNLQEPPPPT
jgi:hypothetical protein